MIILDIDINRIFEKLNYNYQLYNFNLNFYPDTVLKYI